MRQNKERKRRGKNPQKGPKFGRSGAQKKAVKISIKGREKEEGEDRMGALFLHTASTSLRRK